MIIAEKSFAEKIRLIIIELREENDYGASYFCHEIEEFLLKALTKNEN
jgi:hypothetical protein